MQTTQLTLVSDEATYNYSADEINKSLIFQENISDERIKYPYLSKFINDYYVESKFTISNFDTTSSSNTRLEMWKNLGIINEGEVYLNNINNSTIFNMKIKSINKSSGIKEFQAVDIL